MVYESFSSDLPRELVKNADSDDPGHSKFTAVTEFLQGRAQGYIFSKGIPSRFCCTKV